LHDCILAVKHAICRQHSPIILTDCCKVIVLNSAAQFVSSTLCIALRETNWVCGHLLLAWHIYCCHDWSAFEPAALWLAGETELVVLWLVRRRSW